MITDPNINTQHTQLCRTSVTKLQKASTIQGKTTLFFGHEQGVLYTEHTQTYSILTNIPNIIIKFIA